MSRKNWITVFEAQKVILCPPGAAYTLPRHAQIGACVRACVRVSRVPAALVRARRPVGFTTRLQIEPASFKVIDSPYLSANDQSAGVTPVYSVLPAHFPAVFNTALQY